MLQPLQLQDVSTRFVEEIAELRDFLAKSGLALDRPESLGVMAARLRTDRAFHRDLTSYIWTLIYGRRGPVGPAGLLGLLAVAASGARFAADAGENDAHDLLRFVMEAQRSLHNGPTQQETGQGAVVRSTVFSPDLNLPLSSRNSPQVQQGTGTPNRRFGWIAFAVACVLALSAGTWLHLHGGSVTAQQAGVAPVRSLPANSFLPSTLATREAPGPVAARPSAGSSSRRDVARSALRPVPAAIPKAMLAMAGSAPANPATAVQPPLSGTAQPSLSTRAPAASAGRSGIAGYSFSRAVPSAVLSRRLGSPSLPAYTSAQDDDAVLPRRPRLLRRSPLSSSSSTLTDGDAELVAEMNVPPGIAPGGAKSPGTTAAPQGIVRPGSLGIMAANVVYSPAPAYPSAASAAHVQGEVKVQATVDRDGNVASARVISGPPLLRDAALDAVQRWRYRPYLAGGKPASMTALAVMDFQLP